MAYLYGQTGRFYDALHADLRALRVAGSTIYGELQIARVLDLLGDEALADAWRARALRLNPGHPVVSAGAAEIAQSRGHYAQALDLIARVPTLERTPQLAGMEGRLALLTGDQTTARTALMEAGTDGVLDLALLDGRSLPMPDPPADVSLSWPTVRVRLAEYAALADLEAEAFAQLNIAVDLGWRDYGLLVHSPHFQTLKEDPRWVALERRIDREITAQRALINADPALRAALEAIVSD